MPHEVKTVITRAGEGTKITPAVDLFQVRSRYMDRTSSGLTYVVGHHKDCRIGGTSPSGVVCLVSFLELAVPGSIRVLPALQSPAALTIQL